MTQVRRIAADEWQTLRQLRLRSLGDAPGAFGQTYENAAAMPDADWQSNARAAARGNHRAWFVARDAAGTGVGLVQARRRPPSDCLVFSMWVDPLARRGGVGAALLDAVDGWASGWGATRVVLWVYATNEDAQRFYERIRFNFVSDGPDAASGHQYGALAMERAI